MGGKKTSNSGMRKEKLSLFNDELNIEDKKERERESKYLSNGIE